MAAAVPFSDLFDFDGYLRELGKAETRYTGFADSVIKANKEIKSSADQFITTLDKIKDRAGASKSIDELKELAKATDHYVSVVNRQRAMMEQMDNTVAINRRSIDELKLTMKGLKVEYDALKPGQEDFKTRQSEIAAKAKEVQAALNNQNQVLKIATRSASDVAKSYSELSRTTGNLKQQLRQMPNAFDATTGAINRHNKEAAALLKQIEKNDRALKMMDASMGNHQRNVGNYSSAFKGLGSTLADAIPMLAGIGTATQAVFASVETIDRLERLKFSLEAASGSTELFQKRQAFVKDLANQTGQDIEKLTGSYIKFTAAARDTSIEGAQADRIFSAFSKSFSALGASSATAERGLTAIEQMISKGTVGAEELRQQLGDALPGAMRIFADAAGVPVATFQEMMKRGEILALDILPKVVKRLEEMHGDRAQKNLQTISGSWTNLTNQVKFFLDSLNQDGVISRFFAKINNGIAGIVSGFTSLQSHFGVVEKRVQAMRDNKGPIESWWEGGFIGKAQDYLDAAQKVSKENERIGQKMAQFNQIKDVKGRVDAIVLEQKKLQDLNKEYKNHIDSGKDIIVKSSQYRNETLRLNDAIEEQKRLVESMASNRVIPKPGANKTPQPAPSAGGGGNRNGIEREISQYEKLTKQIDAMANSLVDQVLKDVQDGKTLSIPQATIDRWNAIYETLRKTAELTGSDLPKKFRDLNEALNPSLKNVLDDPTNTYGKVEKYEAPKETQKRLFETPDGPETESEFNKREIDTNLLLGQEADRSNLEYRFDVGNLRRIGDKYKAELKKIQGEIQDLEREGKTKEASEARERFRTKEQEAKEEIALRRQVVQESIRLGGELVNALFEINSNFRAAEMENLQAQMDHELALVGDNEEAQKSIKSEYAKKQKELRKEQAKAEKAQAVFSIGVNTALAVMSALAMSGPPWVGIAMAAIVGAMGAIQLATVLAKPLPAFWKGTDNAPEGFATIAERGPELRESKGRMYYYDKPQVTWLEQGDKVYTAGETSGLLDRYLRAADANEIIDRRLTSERHRKEIREAQYQMTVQNTTKIDYERLGQEVAKAMESRPVHQTTFDENGVRKFVTEKNSRIEYLNKRYSLKK